MSNKLFSENFEYSAGQMGDNYKQSENNDAHSYRESVAKFQGFSRLFCKLCAFCCFFSLLLQMGVEANPNAKLMVVVIEVMALLGLCFPAKLFHPIWEARSHLWLILRSCGVLAVCLSWLCLDQGVRQHAVRSDLGAKRASRYQKAIAVAWEEHDRLPINFITQKNKLRHEALELEEKLQKLSSAELGVNDVLALRLYRALILIFTLLSGHWVVRGLF